MLLGGPQGRSQSAGIGVGEPVGDRRKLWLVKPADWGLVGRWSAIAVKGYDHLKYVCVVSFRQPAVELREGEFPTAARSKYSAAASMASQYRAWPAALDSPGRGGWDSQKLSFFLSPGVPRSIAGEVDWQGLSNPKREGP